MFALGLRYLNGWSMATDPTNRSRPEWPPHPDRLFMALAAAHWTTRGNADEYEALLWLEKQGPPGLAGQGIESFHVRTSVISYVPVNDTRSPSLKAGKEPSPKQMKDGLGLLPESRLRQPRMFPVAIPANDTVHFVWPGVDIPEQHRAALGDICRKVTCVGHSASLVQVWLEPKPPEPVVVATDGTAPLRLRVSTPGRLGHLERQYEAGLRPTNARWFGYRRRLDPEPEENALSTVFGQRLLIFRRLDGPRLGLEATLRITQALRDAILSACPEPVPEWVLGHTANGKPSERPHLAIMPLGHVGRRHADGHLLGVGLAIPKRIDVDEQMRCLGPWLYDDLGLPRACELRLGRLGLWKVQIEDRKEPPRALQAETWTGAADESASRRWATVTPIVLDRYPKRDGDAEAIVAKSCERVGLPRPADVILSSVSLFEGAPVAQRFPALNYRNSGRPRRFHIHAVITFEEAVRGPVLLGAGRYRGYGLCRSHKPSF